MYLSGKQTTIPVQGLSLVSFLVQRRRRLCATSSFPPSPFLHTLHDLLPLPLARLEEQETDGVQTDFNSQRTVHIHTCVHICTYTYLRTRIYANIHTYAWRQMDLCIDLPSCSHTITLVLQGSARKGFRSCASHVVCPKSRTSSRM